MCIYVGLCEKYAVQIWLYGKVKYQIHQGWKSLKNNKQFEKSKNEIK